MTDPGPPREGSRAAAGDAPKECLRGRPGLGSLGPDGRLLPRVVSVLRRGFGGPPWGGTIQPSATETKTTEENEQ